VFRLFERATTEVAAPPTHRPRPARRARRSSAYAGATTPIARRTAVPIAPAAPRPDAVAVPVDPGPSRIALPWREPELPPHIVVETHAWPPEAWWRGSLAASLRAAPMREAMAASVERAAESRVSVRHASPAPSTPVPAMADTVTDARAIRSASTPTIPPHEPRQRSLFARVALLVASVVISFIVVEAVAGRTER
jgi:hypothetical protein